jgi:hypothetical protein
MTHTAWSSQRAVRLPERADRRLVVWPGGLSSARVLVNVPRPEDTHDRPRGQNLHMARRAAIYSAPEASVYGWIEFAEPRFDIPGGDFGCRFTLAIGGDEWSLDLVMIEPYTADMLGFFEEIAQPAAEWLEPKRWESEDGEVAITATHADTSAVQFRVRMRWPPEYEAEVVESLVVRRSELEDMARQMRSLVELPHGQRFWRVDP